MFQKKIFIYIVFRHMCNLNHVMLRLPIKHTPGYPFDKVLHLCNNVVIELQLASSGWSTWFDGVGFTFCRHAMQQMLLCTQIADVWNVWSFTTVANLSLVRPRLAWLHFSSEAIFFWLQLHKRLLQWSRSHFNITFGKTASLVYHAWLIVKSTLV